MERNPRDTVPPCPLSPSRASVLSTRLGGVVRTNDVDVPQILLAGVLTVLCPVLVSPRREAYRRSVGILVLLIILVLVRAPMSFPEPLELPTWPMLIF